MFLAHEAHRDHGPIPLELVGDRRKDEGNRGAAIDGGGLSGEVIDQNAAHLLDVDIGNGRVKGVPGPSPVVAGYVAKRLVGAKTKPDFVAVSYSLSDWVIAAYGSGFCIWSAAHVCASYRARKPETELDWTISVLPRSESTKLKARVGHYIFRQLRLFERRIAAGRGIKHSNRGTILK